MTNESLTMEQVLALLAATRPRIAELTVGLRRLNSRPLPVLVSGRPMKCWLICVRVPTFGATV